MRRITALDRFSRLLVVCGPFFAVVFILSLADILLSGYTEPKNTFRAMVDSSQPVNGKLGRPAQSADRLGYVLGSHQEDARIRLTFYEVRGSLWRGELHVPAGTSPGIYGFQVVVAGQAPAEDSSVYHVLVFDSRKQLNESYKSFVRRHLGISPVWMMLAALPLLMTSLAGSYYQSSRQENQLARKGIVPILKMVRRKDGWEVMFALGFGNGLRVHDQLLLLNADFEQVGHVTVSRVSRQAAHANIPFDESLEPTYWVCLPKPDSGADPQREVKLDE
jgi:hypothetical protein